VIDLNHLNWLMLLVT